jgi:hypothetical protein
MFSYSNDYETSVGTVMKPLQFQLVLAWVWIWLGFLSGLGLGLFFHRENWLGGYTSLTRRLYRLCHISFFGLGLLNLCFYLTVQVSGATGTVLTVASWAFIVGAVSMPLCCLLMAHFPPARLGFGVPVVSLLVGGALTVLVVGSTCCAGFRAPVKGSPTFSVTPFREHLNDAEAQTLRTRTKDSAI